MERPEATSERLEHALAAADTGVWTWEAGHDRVRLSPEMRRMLGRIELDLPTDATGLAKTVDARDAGRLRRALVAALAGDGLFDLEARFVRTDGEIRWLRVAGDIERGDDGAPTRAGGIAQDITGQKRLEQRLTIADAVSRILARAASFEEAVPELLRAIAAGTGMEVCGLWMPTSDGSLLECIQIHADTEARQRLQRFIERTMETRLRPGEGLVGRAWQDRKAIWVESMAHERGFEGARAAATEGLTSGVAIPLSSSEALLGVVDVFTSQPSPPDPLLLETLVGLGDELGQFIQRMRAETSVRESDARQRLLVTLMQAQRDTEDPDEIVHEAAAVLGRHLLASRVGFLELVEPETIRFLPGWTADGTAALDWTLPTSAIGGAYLAQIHKGEAVVIEDMVSDSPTVDSSFAQLGVRAAIVVPTVRSGRWSAGLYVHQDHPRRWSEGDVVLAREIADHTWDAVERARAQKARRESEDLARTIADNSTQSLVMQDRRGFVRYANAAMLELTGYDGEEIRSAPLHDLVHHHHPDGRPYALADCPIWRASIERQTLQEHEDVFFRKDGTPIPVECAVGPVFGSGRAGSVIIEIRDLSASRAAELALRASEQRFRATFENAAVGVAHVGLDGRWLRVNDKLCQITGYSAEQLVGMSFQEVTHPADLEHDLAQVERVLAGDIDMYTIEKRYVRLDGSPVWVELTVSLVRDARGEPEYFIAIVIDIGERKMAEARVRTAMAVKDEFLGLVSHELRTPMTVILGMSQILAADRLEPERAREVALDVANSAHELNELIESMLLLSRLDHDEMTSEPVLLGRTAAEVMERQRRRDSRHRYRLTTSPDSLVEAHPGLVDRVITNLLTNAAKYSDSETDIRVVVRARKDEVSLRVMDRGPGLADESMAQVFEPFYRAPKAMTSPGLGLGLAVAHRIVESLGGRIWVKRRRTRGSEFGFALPRLRDELEAMSAVETKRA